MADDKNDKKPGTEEPAAPAKGNKSQIMIIAGVAVLCLSIGVPLGMFVFKSKPVETDALSTDAAEKDEGEELKLEGFDDEDEIDEGEEALGAIFPLETFVVNLSGGGFVRIQVSLEFVERDVPRRFYVRLVPLRDAIINLLANKTNADVSTEKGRESIKIGIKELANDLIKKEDVRTVYFTQFVVQ